MIERTMVHLNFNMMASIWIETTGPDPRRHDIFEICILLLDNHFRMSQAIVPFYIMIQPLRPENINIEDYKSGMKTKIEEATIKGLPPSVAADRLEDWIAELDMPHGKKIVPLVFDWEHTSGFLRNWLGIQTYRHLISSDARDIQTVALFTNDRANVRAQPIPYPKVFSGFIGQHHKITLQNSMDVMEKAVRLADIYRVMIGGPLT